ncbi:hypothetical protein [Streptomyces sp. NPDC058964]|uniref:hypothetical protein n=1 Tax=Streptomyces sp. NPDC058964 TaxID=3346681 RepID=UPI0036ADE13A
MHIFVNHPGADRAALGANIYIAANGQATRPGGHVPLRDVLHEQAPQLGGGLPTLKLVQIFQYGPERVTVMRTGVTHPDPAVTLSMRRRKRARLLD